MALRPRTVKAGSLAAIAVPSVLGSTLVAPASAFAPVVQDIPGAATQAPKSLFTSTVQPTLSQVAVQIRQQAEQAKQTQQAPATTAVQPIQKTYTAQAVQPAPGNPAGCSLGYLPVRTGCAGYPGCTAFRSARADRTGCSVGIRCGGNPHQPDFPVVHLPGGTTSQYHVYAEGVDFSKPVGVVFYFDGDYWQRDESKVYTPRRGHARGDGQDC